MSDNDPQASPESGTDPEATDNGQRLAQDSDEREIAEPPSVVDAVFRLLSVHRRRCVLYLLQEDDVIDLERLATAVTAMRQQRAPTAVSAHDVETTRLRLVHADIPLLEEIDAVEYDSRTDALRYSDPPALLESLLGRCVGIDDPSASPN